MSEHLRKDLQNPRSGAELPIGRHLVHVGTSLLKRPRRRTLQQQGADWDCKYDPTWYLSGRQLGRTSFINYVVMTSFPPELKTELWLPAVSSLAKSLVIYTHTHICIDLCIYVYKHRFTYCICVDDIRPHMSVLSVLAPHTLHTHQELQGLKTYLHHLLGCFVRNLGHNASRR